MKASFSLCLLVFLSCVTNSVVAYGIRGAAERALYYMAYLAEENTPGSKFTIAPGCIGTERGGGITRCSLKEFLLYIWKETKPDDEVKPTGWKRPPKETNFDATQNTMDSLISTISTARTNEGKTITGNTDSERLMPGSGDYYEVLGKMGEPINRMVTAMGANPTNKQKRIVAKSKAAVEAIVGLRYLDLEKYRLDYLRKALKSVLGEGATVETSKWRTGFQGNPAEVDKAGNAIPNTKGIAFDTLDVAATIKANGAASADIVIQQAQEYMTHNDIAKNHFAAIKGAEKSAISMGCAVPGS